MKAHYELVIIGGGPAGLTAAIYACRRGIDTLLISHTMGGQTAWSADIENYLGFNMISGPDLTAKFFEHVKKFDDDNALFNLEVIEGGEVVKLAKDQNYFSVSLKDGQTTAALSVIITSGKTPRLLKIPGEEKLLGKGVTFCATCDAPLYRNKVVAVIGGGNSALDATLQLMTIAKFVHLLTINDALTGEQVMIDKIKSSDKVKIYYNTETLSIEGGNTVSGLKVKNKNTNQEALIKVAGVFEEIGSVPSVDFCRDLVKLNKYNEIVVDELMRTSVPGVFAAGDVTPVPFKQIIVAAGEGCKAALEAHNYLARLKNSQ